MSEAAEEAPLDETLNQTADTAGEQLEGTADLPPEEALLFACPAHLFAQDQTQDGTPWVERGTGEVQLIRQEDSVRVFMVSEQDQMILNHFIEPNFEIKTDSADEASVIWAASDFNGEETTDEVFKLTFDNPEDTKAYTELFERCIHQDNIRDIPVIAMLGPAPGAEDDGLMHTGETDRPVVGEGEGEEGLATSRRSGSMRTERSSMAAMLTDRSDEEGQNPEPHPSGEDEEEHEGDMEYEEEMEEEDEVMDQEKLMQYIDNALAKHSQLLADNTDLQRRYALYLQNNPSEQHEEEKSDDEIRPQYFDAIQQIESLRIELHSVQEGAEQVKEEAQTRLEEARQELLEAERKFNEYKLHIGKSARSKATGKPIDERELAALMERDRRQDEEIQMKRLENTTLQTALAKYEKTHKKTDESSKQHHQIDFEQLKIENQTFNEKIEERTEELQKLRKKINVTVHVLSHFTEKLEFLHSANKEQKARLNELEKETTRKRDKLANIKLERDRLKVENQRLKQENGLVGNEELLRDFKERRRKQNQLKKRLIALQRRYEEITGEDVTQFSEKLFKAANEGNKVSLGDDDEDEEAEEEEEGFELGEAVPGSISKSVTTKGTTSKA